MTTGWGDPSDVTSATSARERRESAEHELLERVQEVRGAHLTAADGVATAAYALIDELRAEGVRCEHALVTVKGLVSRVAAHPEALLDELVPLCIVRYYPVQA